MRIAKIFSTALLFLASTVVTAKSPAVLSPEFVIANLEKDVTTKEDVIRLFGEPAQRKVRVSSESGSIEYLVYSNSAPERPDKKRQKGAGFGGILRAARGVAGDVAAVTGKNYYGSDTADALSRAEHAADAVDRASSIAASSDDDEKKPSQERTLTLTIELTNGVVTRYELE